MKHTEEFSGKAKKNGPAGRKKDKTSFSKSMDKSTIS